MPTRPVSPIKGRKVRVTRLNECGVPVTGTGSAQLVTSGFVSLSPSPQYADGEEFQTRRADGTLCVNEQDDSELTRIDMETIYCQMNPELIALQTGEDLLTAGGLGVSGTGFTIGEGQISDRFSVEVWQNVAGDDACSEDGEPLYVYWVFFNVGNARLGDYTIENAASNITINSSTKAKSSLWLARMGDVPWLDGNVIASGKHSAVNITSEPPPEDTNGTVEWTP